MISAKELIYSILHPLNISSPYDYYITVSTLATIVMLLALLVDFLTKKILLVSVSRVVEKSKTQWDDVLLKNKTFKHLSHFSPLIFLYFSLPFLFPENELIHDLLVKLIKVSSILVGLLTISSFFSSVNEIYSSYEFSKQKPIKGYIQVLKIILTFIAIILILSILFNKSLVYFFSGLGAFTVVLMLVFKDSILGLVAGVQLTSNKMVQLGDWIVMNKYGADGDVIEISLHTVKVQNWDKTITTIPTYALISESFQNYRGMVESGGRRIKRSIYIDMLSIGFCSKEMIDRLKKIHFLKEYITGKEQEIEDYNKANNIDKSIPVNGRSLTNIGVFRQYIQFYLRNHPQIHQNMTFLIRQLEPTEKGLPMQIYVFTKDTRWVYYEGIQSDIFDHILSIIPEFGLRVFQMPSGSDIAALSNK